MPANPLAISLRRPGNDLLRAGQFGERRVGFSLIPVSHAVIIVPALERRAAVALFNHNCFLGAQIYFDPLDSWCRSHDYIPLLRRCFFPFRQRLPGNEGKHFEFAIISGSRRRGFSRVPSIEGRRPLRPQQFCQRQKNESARDREAGFEVKHSCRIPFVVRLAVPAGHVINGDVG